MLKRILALAIVTIAGLALTGNVEARGCRASHSHVGLFHRHQYGGNCSTCGTTTYTTSSCATSAPTACGSSGCPINATATTTPYTPAPPPATLQSSNTNTNQNQINQTTLQGTDQQGRTLYFIPSGNGLYSATYSNPATNQQQNQQPSTTTPQNQQNQQRLPTPPAPGTSSTIPTPPSINQIEQP